MRSRRALDARRQARQQLAARHETWTIHGAGPHQPDLIAAAPGRLVVAAVTPRLPADRTLRLELLRLHTLLDAVPLLYARDTDGRWGWWRLTGPAPSEREPYDLDDREGR